MFSLPSATMFISVNEFCLMQLRAAISASKWISSRVLKPLALTEGLNWCLHRYFNAWNIVCKNLIFWWLPHGRKSVTFDVGFDCAKFRYQGKKLPLIFSETVVQMMAKNMPNILLLDRFLAFEPGCPNIVFFLNQWETSPDEFTTWTRGIISFVDVSRPLIFNIDRQQLDVWSLLSTPHHCM